MTLRVACHHRSPRATALDSLFDPAVFETTAESRPRRIVLVGAGHAHLHVLEGWAKRPIPHAELVLVTAADRAVYCGMLPGVLAGAIPAAEAIIDLRRLCQRGRVTLIVDRAIRLDAERRTIELAHQPALTFDVASINLGSATRSEQLCRQHRTLVSVKPLVTFLERWEPRFRELIAQHQAAPSPDGLHFGIVGAGAAGVELAFALERLLRRKGLPAQITLYDGSRELLSDHRPRVRRLARRELERRGIAIELGRRVVGCHEEGRTSLILDDGMHEPCDLAIWATGAAPPEVLQNFALPHSEDGYLRVRPTLQTIADAPVFVAGDVAEGLDATMPRSAATAIRQGPVLWHNLQQWLIGKPLMNDEPRPQKVALIGCGDGTAILDYHGFIVHTRWAGRWKDRHDRRLVERWR